jgi:hypothetical protein
MYEEPMMTSSVAPYSLSGIARKAGCSRVTVLRAVQRGELKAVKIPVAAMQGQAEQEWYGVDAVEAERWIEARKAKGERRGRKKKQVMEGV